MDAILNFVKETPIASLLILAGLILILLSFINNIGEVEIIPQQRTWAILIGVFLLVIGLTIGSQSKPEKLVDKDNPSEQKYIESAYIDYPYNDIHPSPLSNTSKEECINRCNIEKICVAVVVSPDNICWLKSKLGKSVENSNRTTIRIGSGS